MTRRPMNSTEAIDKIKLLNNSPILIDNNAGVTLEKQIFGEGKDDGKIDFSDNVDLKVVKVKITGNDIIVVDDIFITTANKTNDIGCKFAGSRCELKLHMLLVPWYQTLDNSGKKYATYGTPVKVDIKTEFGDIYNEINNEWTSINTNLESHKNSGTGYNIYSKRKGTGRSPPENQNRAYYYTKYATSKVLKDKQDKTGINFFPGASILTIKELDPRKIRVKDRAKDITQKIGQSPRPPSSKTSRSRTPRTLKALKVPIVFKP